MWAPAVDKMNKSATTRPESASGVWTGPAGLVAGVAGLIIFGHGSAPSYVKTVELMLLVSGAMVAAEASFHGGRRLRPPDGAALAPIPNWHRISVKLLALAVTMGVIAAVYWVFPIYADPYYQPFKDALLLAAPAILAVSPFYFAYVDARQSNPDDAYVEVGRLILGKPPTNWNAVRIHCYGWLVKAFFLPLMFVFLDSDLNRIWAMTSLPALDTFQVIYGHGYDLLYLFDVMLAAVGYTTTLRLLGTEIRSAEPTFWGWAVCLVCYPPFWDAARQYLAYDQDGKYWGDFFWNSPALYTVWGSVILILVAIYVWATVSFGLRFSNLTHRGIITHGPYRWVKHPAYVSKNLTWWMISMPFIAGTDDWTMAIRSSVLLAGVNAIYLLRAISEERHLAADPVYRQYQAYIAEHGLFAVLRRLLTRGRRQLPARIVTDK
jgi:protein-S-isoprenylcysteine O-methyltransferase Ste14